MYSMNDSINKESRKNSYSIDTIKYLYVLFDRLNLDKQYAFVKQNIGLNANTN